MYKKSRSVVQVRSWGNLGCCNWIKFGEMGKMVTGNGKIGNFWWKFTVYHSASNSIQRYWRYVSQKNLAKTNKSTAAVQGQLFSEKKKKKWRKLLLVACANWLNFRLNPRRTTKSTIKADRGCSRTPPLFFSFFLSFSICVCALLIACNHAMWLAVLVLQS